MGNLKQRHDRGGMRDRNNGITDRQFHYTTSDHAQCGHTPQLEQAADFDSLVSEWLATKQRGGCHSP